MYWVGCSLRDLKMRHVVRLGSLAVIFGVCAYLFVAMASRPVWAEETTPKPTTEPNVQEHPGDALKGDQRQLPRRRPPLHPSVIQSTGEGSYSLQCEWLGKRIMNLLIRDDAMAANDFTPFYIRFNCPEDHLARAFGCVVGNLNKIENSALADQIKACWLDPSAKEYTPTPAGEEKPAEETPKSGGESGGKRS